jgi:hypothetical protein
MKSSCLTTFLTCRRSNSDQKAIFIVRLIKSPWDHTRVAGIPFLFNYFLTIDCALNICCCVNSLWIFCLFSLWKRTSESTIYKSMICSFFWIPVWWMFNCKVLLTPSGCTESINTCCCTKALSEKVSMPYFQWGFTPVFYPKGSDFSVSIYVGWHLCLTRPWLCSDLEPRQSPGYFSAGIYMMANSEL